MAYSKTTWKNRVVQNPQTYLQQQNADGTVTLIPKEGTVTEAGTPVNAVNMNNIEEGIATVDTNLGNINDSTLDDSVKGKSLTEMIKVLFQNVDSGKNDVYSAIVGKGTTPASKNFADLVAGINAINTGKKWASGSITYGSNNQTVNLNFQPSVVIIQPVSHPDRTYTYVAVISPYMQDSGGVVNTTSKTVFALISIGTNLFTVTGGQTTYINSGSTVNWYAYE